MTCVDATAWVEELRALRDGGWAMFDWLAVVEDSGQDDSRDQAPGFQVTVQLLRPKRADCDFGRLQVSTAVGPGADLASLTGLWPGAAWHEREAWEMFGLRFTGFTDHSGLGLRPLLLGTTYAEPPLRKSVLLPARTTTPWPGSIEPGEGGSGGAPAAQGGGSRRLSRRRQRPLGVPDPTRTQR